MASDNLSDVLAKYIHDPRLIEQIKVEMKNYRRNWRKYNIWANPEQVETIRKMFPDMKMQMTNPPSSESGGDGRK